MTAGRDADPVIAANRASWPAPPNHLARVHMVIQHDRMRTMNVTDFKARCLAVLDEIERSGDTIVIVRRGKPIARVTGTRAEPVAYPQHGLRGTVETVGDLLAPAVPADAWDAVRAPAARAR